MFCLCHYIHLHSCYCKTQKVQLFSPFFKLMKHDTFVNGILVKLVAFSRFSLQVNCIYLFTNEVHQYSWKDTVNDCVNPSNTSYWKSLYGKLFFFFGQTDSQRYIWNDGSNLCTKVILELLSNDIISTYWNLRHTMLYSASEYRRTL